MTNQLATSRAVALDTLNRIEASQSYANLALGPILERSGLDERDRHFVTEMVYGTLRRRGSCDYLVDRFLTSDPPLEVRNALRLGAYQLHFMATAQHAAVSETVEICAKRFRPLCNAVLRKVAAEPVNWPDDASRLSYPAWIAEMFVELFGAEDGTTALEIMNTAPNVTQRDDGYTQDVSSQLVTSLIDAASTDVVVDVCAAPGGKTTGIAASSGSFVVAADRKRSRTSLIVSNVNKLDVANVAVMIADAAKPALRAGCADWVLVDAPCSGLGVLRRRADARWRIQQGDLVELATLQRTLLDSSAQLVAPGGVLVYSLCTVSRDESIDVANDFSQENPDFEVLPVPAGWRPWGSGGLVLPQDHDSDAMTVFMWRRSGR